VNPNRAGGYALENNGRHVHAEAYPSSTVETMERNVCHLALLGALVGSYLGGALFQPAAVFGLGHSAVAAKRPSILEGDLVSALGVAGNTILVVWGDHGYPLGEKAISGKNTPWERSTRVPLVFAIHDKAKHEEVLNKIRDAVTIAKRVGTQWFTVVPGSMDQQASSDPWNRYGGPRLAEGYQTANVIGLLRRCAEILEPHHLTMVLEPLNWETDHGGVFLRHSDQAYALCKAVNSPACKILFDIYHQQITEGNLIPNIERCWDEIGYFQAGDNPGRKEPGTGEISYRGVFKYIHDRSQRENRDFVIGMEHGNSKPGKLGELAVIQAYRDADAF
jgi:hydroxypyruvate isomerase